MCSGRVPAYNSVSNVVDNKSTVKSSPTCKKSVQQVLTPDVGRYLRVQLDVASCIYYYTVSCRVASSHTLLLSVGRSVGSTTTCAGAGAGVTRVTHVTVDRDVRLYDV